MPVPTPGDLPDPRVIPMSLGSLALGDGFFTIVQLLQLANYQHGVRSSVQSHTESEIKASLT